MNELPPLSSLDLIRKRLSLIFPDGTEHRNYVVRDIAVKLIFLMLYAGAIEGTNRWVRPNQVIKMTDDQASKTRDDDRFKWVEESLKPGFMKGTPGQWYAGDTREPIRDETIRIGFMQYGCIIERQGLATTSPAPRYALKTEFAKLFDEKMNDEDAEASISEFQETHMSPEALARIRLMKRSLSASKDNKHVLVTFPNGEKRQMASGASSLLSKAVIEEFTNNFLKDPALILLSESREKIIAQDNKLAKKIGIDISADRVLPDIILADLDPKVPLLVFVEVVHSDGQISKHRKQELLTIANKGKYREEYIVFVTAFSDRGSSAYKKLCSDLAWGSLVWFASEPECIVVLIGNEEMKDKSLMDIVNLQKF